MNITRQTRRRPPSRRGKHLVLEPLEARMLLAGDPILEGQPLIITELMADNHATLLSRTRTSGLEPFEGIEDAPDWIEILNVSGQQQDIGGMHLTDDPDAPTKWQFPAGTAIDAGAFLVVLASGSDIRDPSLDEHGYLHTNFGLSRAGEYLALTNRDGQVMHEFSPTFPAQQTDVSYAVPMDVRTLLGPDSPLEYLVPTDDSLAPEWRLPGFTDPNLIGGTASTTSPVGFDRGGGPVEPGETIGAELADRPSVDFSRGSIVVLQSRPFTEVGRVAEWSFYSEKTNSITPLILRAAGEEFEIVGIGRTRTSDGSGPQTFAFDLQSGRDEVEPEGYYFGFKDGDNQTDDAGAIVWGRSDSDTVRRYNGPLSGSVVAGQPLSGGRGFDRTFSVQATTRARLAGPIHTDVDSAMAGATSLYVRYPFTAEQLDTLQTLSLRVRYDDGFAAYLNGTEVARRNAPEMVQFDSTATSDQPLRDANRFEEINISQFIGALTEGQNVLAIHGLNDDSAGSEFMLDAQLLGIDIPAVAGVGFADDPTPGFANGTIYSGFVSPPSFSHGRGFYDEPFALQLTTPGTSDATIYFTTDGSDPTPENPKATRYQQPVEISGTSLLRAASYQDGRLPLSPQTHTYIFPRDVVTQDTLQPAITEDPVWGPQLVDSLKAVPTISLVTTNPISLAGEVGTSVELIYPDGTEGFQVDAGVELTGGTSLAFAKQSMRLSFKKIYGPSTLEFDVFRDPEGVTQFDQLMLRSGSQDSAFVSDPNVGGSTYFRNRWAYDLQREMGQAAPRGQFVHVYINGQYWGQYHLMERPNAAFMASNLGGDEADYDVLNAGRAINGDDLAWNAMIDAVDDGYEAVRNYLDVVNYADYMLLNFYGGNDWDWRADFNWIAGRRREPGAGFQFFAWDSDNFLRRGANSNVVYLGSPGHLWTIHGGVQQYPEFLRLMAERAQKYLYDGGMFTAERLGRDIDALAQRIRLSIIAETARWGSGLYSPDTWEEAIDWVKQTYAPEDGASRAEIVIEQMRQAGLFPLSERPQFSVAGQLVEGNHVDPGAQLTISAPEGIVYYTLDGSDPWQQTPTVEYTLLIAESAPARLLVPRDDALQSDWLAPEFDDSTWIRGETGIGYDTLDGFTELIGLNVQEPMKDVNATVYVRVPFVMDDPAKFDTLQLSVQYDDGYVAYLNGVEVARRNAPETLTWNSHATRTHPNVDAREFERFNLTRVKHLLRPGQNVLAIHALNIDPTNVDLLMTPMLQAGRVTDIGVSPTAVRFSDPITVPPGADIKARTVWGDQWSTLREAATAPPEFPLRISEVMFHPADPTGPELAAGITDGDDFEFIELTNIANSPIDLSGVHLVQTAAGDQSEGVDFDFGRGAIRQLAPGQRVLVVENMAAFGVRYGNGLPVAGQWRGGLSNSSETIALAANDIVVGQFAYDDAWYPPTDGQGYSLELIDVSGTPVDQYGDWRRWRPSEVLGGTPGQAADALALPGDANGDGRFDAEDLDWVLAAGKYQTGEAATFQQGDFNRDGVFDRYDIVEALIRSGFQSAVGAGFAARAGIGAPELSRFSPELIRVRGLPGRLPGDLIDLAMDEILGEESIW